MNTVLDHLIPFSSPSDVNPNSKALYICDGVNRGRFKGSNVRKVRVFSVLSNMTRKKGARAET